MAQLTVTEILARVRDFMPNKPQAGIIRALNDTIEEIHELVAQPERSTFTTRAPTTSGTVSVAAASAAVTFSGTPLASTDTMMLIQFGGDSAWYVLTYVTTSTGTLSSVYAGTTNTVATYRIVYPTVVFGSTVGRVSMVRHDGFTVLECVEPANAELWFQTTTYGRPLRWSPYVYGGTSPDDSHRVTLDPAPDAAYAMTYIFVRRPAVLSLTDDGTGKTSLPSLFNRAITLGTVARCWDAQDGEDKARSKYARYEEAVRAAMATTAAEGPPVQRQSAWQAHRPFFATQGPPA